jgi:hypothetical protein
VLSAFDSCSRVKIASTLSLEKEGRSSPRNGTAENEKIFWLPVTRSSEEMAHISTSSFLPPKLQRVTTTSPLPQDTVWDAVWGGPQQGVVRSNQSAVSLSCRLALSGPDDPFCEASKSVTFEEQHAMKTGVLHFISTFVLP